MNYAPAKPSEVGPQRAYIRNAHRYFEAYHLPQACRKPLLHASFVILILCGHAPVIAAWISEVQPISREIVVPTETTTVTIPPMIELSDMAGVATSELVIIDASEVVTRKGTVLEVIPIANGPEVRLITDASWPTTIFPYGDMSAGIISTAPGDHELSLGGNRTILLFDHPTGLIANAGTITEQMATIDTTRLLDAVTYGPFAQNSLLPDTPILSTANGHTIARPMQSNSEPWESLYLIGAPNTSGSFVHIAPAFTLNPGLRNDVWAPASIPEPTTSLLWIASCFVLTNSQRRCKNH